MNYSHIRKTDKGQILGILKDIYPVSYTHLTLPTKA